jgi:hypothetical protein
MECTTIGLDSLNELFNLGITAEVNEYSRKYKELAREKTSD